MLYFNAMPLQPFPLPLIGCALLRHEEMLRRVAFEASRKSAAESREYTQNYLRTRILPDINQTLRRRRVQVFDMWMSFRRHHSVHFKYHVDGCPDVSLDYAIVLYEPSKKTQTMDKRKMEEDSTYDPDDISYAKRS